MSSFWFQKDGALSILLKKQQGEFLSRFSIAFIVGLFLLNSNLSMAAEKNGGLRKTAESKKGTIVSHPTVIIETNKGNIEAELWEDKAPITVKNFLTYADEKFYDNTIFHRVISGFMVQGGGMTADMKEKDSKHEPIKNEATNGALNERGTLAMARTMIVDSATSQFFINLVDNDFLDHKGKSPQTYGYAVFGKVTKGLETVDAIAKVATGNAGHHQNVPKEPVVIKSIRRK